MGIFDKLFSGLNDDNHDNKNNIYDGNYKYKLNKTIDNYSKRIFDDVKIVVNSIDFEEFWNAYDELEIINKKLLPYCNEQVYINNVYIQDMQNVLMKRYGFEYDFICRYVDEYGEKSLSSKKDYIKNFTKPVSDHINSIIKKNETTLNDIKENEPQQLVIDKTITRNEKFHDAIIQTQINICETYGIGAAYTDELEEGVWYDNIQFPIIKYSNELDKVLNEKPRNWSVISFRLFLDEGLNFYSSFATPSIKNPVVKQIYSEGINQTLYDHIMTSVKYIPILVESIGDYMSTEVLAKAVKMSEIGSAEMMREYDLFFNIYKKLIIMKLDLDTVNIPSELNAAYSEVKSIINSLLQDCTDSIVTSEKQISRALDHVNKPNWDGKQVNLTLSVHFGSFRSDRLESLLKPHLKALFSTKVSRNEYVGITEYNPTNLQRIHAMDGVEFEEFCADILRNDGFTIIEMTPASGDQGADIICEKDFLRYAVQCKRYSGQVGNSVVQEVHASKAFYGCDKAIVITNSTFTKGAEQLASSTGVLLWDIDKISEMI